MAKQNGGMVQGGKMPVVHENDGREVFIPRESLRLVTEAPEPVTMTAWEKFKKRLAEFSGKMVTLTIMVDKDGQPLCWSTPDDMKRIENLPTKSNL